MRMRLFVFSGLFYLALCSCGGGEQQKPLTESELKSEFEKANKLMVQHERKAIEEFIVRHQLSMDSTGTGLRYQIYVKGEGRTPVPHDEVVLAYRVFFLNSDPIYDIPESHPDTFRIAEGQLVNGLEEALSKMNQGAKARLILPAHLAYGMIGDEHKIPGATPLFYDLQLIKINP